ncbi:hypothetical protein QYY77_10160 [Xanthomonas campestris pv. campestris]|uniref:hypothetical protein n=1 Tax=Xanthomonas campestris TaxID=339 RepID=UPI0015FECD33|nr:hypothetical protein [Xanthomonas campestris]MCC5074489.1 hypothetical protein [Xanthomonas campestris pv. plantaginis]MCW1977698.1 hypothetical protein [Xanthomonas campestris]MEA0736445.1 hypothetical protein [Xanthomonas campestris pv. campestris]
MTGAVLGNLDGGDKKAAFGPLFFSSSIDSRELHEVAAAWYANVKLRQLLPTTASIRPRLERVETQRRHCHIEQTEVQRFDQIGEHLHRHHIGEQSLRGFTALRVSRSQTLIPQRTTALQDAKCRAQPTLYHSH